MGRAKAMMSKAGFTKKIRELMWYEVASTATRLSNIIVKKRKTRVHMKNFTIGNRDMHVIYKHSEKLLSQKIFKQI